MKKYLVILTVVLAALFILAYKNLTAGKNPQSAEDLIKLEDSIIIKGIEMESDEPPAEDDQSGYGRIIFDDSFMGTGNKGAVKKYQAGEPGEKHAVPTFESLRKKDPRWHLVEYRIKKNDNLWRIASRYSTNPSLIIQVNGIRKPDMLDRGKTIMVPSRNGVYHRVRKGDTVIKIARIYGVHPEKIAAHNSIEQGRISSGAMIFIPEASESKSEARKHEERQKSKTPSRIAKTGIRLIWPLYGKITSGFGKRMDPFSGERRFHCGIDISANVGTPVKAAAGGRVIFSGWKDGYGQTVIIRHDGGYISVYAHNSKNIAVEADIVKQGQVLAYSGMTGAVTGAHLHFEFRKYVIPLNPLRFFK
ncbi:MAG: M23 family metallopeptidase [Spirochaetes bacterium]|jgi:murein DD-endopeptidase MepM/ murein hydrolase activator NlpD|nr:M23 family metallopeptidase [Spirochaetota bacterium]